MKRLLACCAAALLWAGAASAQVTFPLANDNSTGTLVNKLAKATGAPSTAIITATTDFTGILGVVTSWTGTATTGNANIATSGQALCIIDAGGVTAGSVLVNSTTTAGACSDGTGKSGMQVVGLALTTATSGNTTLMEVYTGRTISLGAQAPTTITATGNISMSRLTSTTVCQVGILYNSSSAGTLTIQSDATPGCATPITAISTGLATVAVSGGTFHSNTACAANPRTKEAGSTIWVWIQSNAGSAPVVNVSGDCG